MDGGDYETLVLKDAFEVVDHAILLLKCAAYVVCFGQYVAVMSFWLVTGCSSWCIEVV
jgi:hypothetical protein